MNDETIKFALSKQKIFQAYSPEQLEKIVQCSKVRTVEQGDFLIREGRMENTFYLVLDGEMEILKADTPIGTVQQGGILGESVFHQSFRSASVQALKQSTVIEISLPHLKEALDPHELAVLKDRIFESLFKKLSEADSVAIFAIKQHLKDQEEQSLIADFIVYVMSLILLYVFVIQAISVFQIKFISSSIISIPVLILFGTVMIAMMKRSHYPLKAFGLTLKNGGRAVLESLLLTLPILVLLTVVKWAAIHVIPTFSSLSVFYISPALNTGAPPVGIGTAILLVAVYCLFVPIQEIIYRGAMQSSLQIFLKKKHSVGVAILVSNIPFCMIHFHLSLILTVFVYFFGLFWGWLYARQRTLIGCIASHLLIGFYAFFIIGVQDLLLY